MRTVIFHYHLFKNAGTSLDATLKKNFPDDLWVTKEFPNNKKLNAEQVKQWILDQPNALCFSSHTASLPPPQIEGVKIIPVIFMRHPIDRIVSAYSFEKKQDADTFGSVLARNTTLEGYIETRLSVSNDYQCRNFHVEQFSVMYGGGKDNEEKLANAKKAVDNLPFVGDVGKFNESIQELELLLKENGFDINLTAEQKNISQKSKTIDEKMNSLKEQVGENMYVMLFDANVYDLKLYEYLSKR